MPLPLGTLEELCVTNKPPFCFLSLCVTLLSTVMCCRHTVISKALSKEGLTYSPKSVSLLLRKVSEGQTIFRKPSSGRPSKVTQRVKDILEEQMQKVDATTAAELDRILQREGIKLSRSAILRCR